MEPNQAEAIIRFSESLDTWGESVVKLLNALVAGVEELQERVRELELARQ